MYIKILSTLIFIFLTVFHSFGQQKVVTVSGKVSEKTNHTFLPYVTIVLRAENDSTFVSGTVSNEEGRFSLSIKPGNYYLEFSFVGYITSRQSLYVGTLTDFLDIATIELTEDTKMLNEVVISGTQDAVGEKLDKKTFTVSDNISQSGGSVLQTMQSLPGVTVQDGKILLRGNERVTVLIDGKQTALTGVWKPIRS